MGRGATLGACTTLLCASCSLAIDLDPLVRGDEAGTSQSASGAGALGPGSGGVGASGPSSGGGPGAAGGAGGSGAPGGAPGSTGGAGGGGTSGVGGGLQVLRFGEHELSDVTGVTTDTYVHVDTPTFTYGSDVYFEADGDPARVALLRFDLTALAPGSQVTAADLHVWTTNNASPTGAFALHEVLEAWDEGSGSGEDGFCNWTHRKPSVPWTAAGVGPGSRSVMLMAQFMPNGGYTEYTVALPTDVVQKWVDEPLVNHGMAMVTASSDAAEFRASEHNVVDARPRLDITFMP